MNFLERLYSKGITESAMGERKYHKRNNMNHLNKSVDSVFSSLYEEKYDARTSFLLSAANLLRQTDQRRRREGECPFRLLVQIAW